MSNRIGTNENTPTPQEVLANAVKKTENAFIQNSVTGAELAISLANAQARMHSATQAEVENLFKVLSGGGFTGEQRMKASKKVATLLGLD